jgi:hypothetical protein
MTSTTATYGNDRGNMCAEAWSYPFGALNDSFAIGRLRSLSSSAREPDENSPQYRGAAEPYALDLSGAEDLVLTFEKDTDPAWGDDVGGKCAFSKKQCDDYRVRRNHLRFEALLARIARRTQISDGDLQGQSISKDSIHAFCGTGDQFRIAKREDLRRHFICHGYDV